MQFEEAQRKQAELAKQLHQGSLTSTQFAAAANQMQVRDAGGVWWQPSPDGNGWLRYTGTQWVPATPPSAGEGAGSPPSAVPDRAKDFNEFKTSLMGVDDFRKMAKEVPLAKRPQPWWDLLSILGGIVSAVFWLLYSGIREGFDIITPLLMIGIPVILVWFRTDIDQMLKPLQPYREKVPKLLLIGIGIAFPFLTSFVLYSIGIKEYMLIQANMLIGTLGAYAITRTPVFAAAGGGKSSSRPLPAGGFIALIVAAVCAFLVLPVRADDCTRDILNANDCLRTDGYAEVISGGFSSIVSILINGPTIIQTLIHVGPGIQPPAPPAPPAQPQTPPQQTPPETPEQKALREAEEAQRQEALRRMKEEKARLEAQEAARKKALQDARKKMLDNLDKMSQSMAKRKEFSPEEYERVLKQMSSVRKQLYGEGDVDTDKYAKIYKFFKNRVEGKTIPEGMIPSEAQLFRETMQQTVESTSREVFTGVDAEGNISYKAMALRTIVAGATGGSSELVYTPASATYTMKDYVDKGGNSILGGFGAAMKDVFIGEGIGRGGGLIFKYGGKAIGSLANKFLPQSAINSMTSSITSVKDGLAKLKNVLNTEIKNPFAAQKGGLSTLRTPPKTTGEIINDIKRAKTTGQPSPGLDDVSFKPADLPPDLAGTTVRDQKVIRMVSDKYGVNAHVRPTKAGAAQKLLNGEAHAKPEALKTKAIDADDLELGFDKKSQDLVGCKKPSLPSEKPPGMTDKKWSDLNKRYDQRMQEYNDQAANLKKMEKDGLIKWDRDSGIIKDAETGKPFVSDNDMFAYTDPVTGKPVSKFTTNQINKELQAHGTTMHNEHANWDYSKYSKTPGTGGEQSAFEKASGIDSKILNSHTQGATNAKPLNTYNSLTGRWETSWYSGSGTRNFGGGAP